MSQGGSGERKLELSRSRMAAAVLGSAMMVGLLGASSAFAVKPKEPLLASFELKGSHHYEISGLGYAPKAPTASTTTPP